jgi:hypothetical protein
MALAEKTLLIQHPYQNNKCKNRKNASRRSNEHEDFLLKSIRQNK